MNEEWPGVDTIRGLTGNPPMKQEIPFKLMWKQQLLLQEWNSIYVAIIPYCFKCKEPLVWHHNTPNEVLFHCPKCDREWVKDSKWGKDKEKEIARGKIKK